MILSVRVNKVAGGDSPENGLPPPQALKSSYLLSITSCIISITLNSPNRNLQDKRSECSLSALVEFLRFVGLAYDLHLGFGEIAAENEWKLLNGENFVGSLVETSIARVLELCGQSSWDRIKKELNFSFAKCNMLCDLPVVADALDTLLCERVGVDSGRPQVPLTDSAQVELRQLQRRILIEQVVCLRDAVVTLASDNAQLQDHQQQHCSNQVDSVHQLVAAAVKGAEGRFQMGQQQRQQLDEVPRSLIIRDSSPAGTVRTSSDQAAASDAADYAGLSPVRVDLIRKALHYSAAADQVLLHRLLFALQEDMMIPIHEPHGQQQHPQAQQTAVEFLQQHIRSALPGGPPSFEVGMHALRCQLPRDRGGGGGGASREPLRLSVLLGDAETSSSACAEWASTLADHLRTHAMLHRISNRRNNSGGGGGSGSAGKAAQQRLHTVDPMVQVMHQDPDAAARAAAAPATSAPESGGKGLDFMVEVKSGGAGVEVQLTLDGGRQEARVCCNAQADLCLLTFLEEVALLVGRDDLFKRSLLLLRAWWHYETVAYVGESIGHYLPDAALCVMLCAIFNLHAAAIRTPLQALALFLAQYSEYDPATQVITLQGLRAFDAVSADAALGLDTAQQGQEGQMMLLGPDFILKHWLLANPNETPVPALAPSPKGGSAGQDGFAFDNDSRCAEASIADQTGPDQSLGGDEGGAEGLTQASLDTEKVQAAAALKTKFCTHFAAAFVNSCELSSLDEDSRNCAEGSGISKKATASYLHSPGSGVFQRRVFNVLHPFLFVNLAPAPPVLSSSRLVRLSKVWRSGNTGLAVVLNQEEGGETAGGHEMRCKILQAFFPGLCTALELPASATGGGAAAAKEETATCHGCWSFGTCAESLQRLEEAAHLCNLMQRRTLTPQALLALLTDLLEQRGPVPIGEVGKILTETTGIRGLSLLIKEQFGGLKRFVESEHARHRIILGNDHPFNPHLALRSCLGADDLALVDKGVIPMQAILAVKQAKLTAAAASKSVQLSASTGGSSAGNGSGNAGGSSGRSSSKQGSQQRQQRQQQRGDMLYRQQGTSSVHNGSGRAARVGGLGSGLAGTAPASSLSSSSASFMRASDGGLASSSHYHYHHAVQPPQHHQQWSVQYPNGVESGDGRDSGRDGGRDSESSGRLHRFNSGEATDGSRRSSFRRTSSSSVDWIDPEQQQQAHAMSLQHFALQPESFGGPALTLAAPLYAAGGSRSSEEAHPYQHSPQPSPSARISSTSSFGSESLFWPQQHSYQQQQVERVRSMSMRSDGSGAATSYSAYSHEQGHEHVGRDSEDSRPSFHRANSSTLSEPFDLDMLPPSHHAAPLAAPNSRVQQQLQDQQQQQQQQGPSSLLSRSLLPPSYHGQLQQDPQLQSQYQQLGVYTPGSLSMHPDQMFPSQSPTGATTGATTGAVLEQREWGTEGGGGWGGMAPSMGVEYDRGGYGCFSVRAGSGLGGLSGSALVDVKSSQQMQQQGHLGQAHHSRDQHLQNRGQGFEHKAGPTRSGPGNPNVLDFGGRIY